MDNKLTKILYLGPNGSYTELASKNFSDYLCANCDYEPVDSIYKIIKKLSHTESNLTGAIIPIENSIEGIVRESQDNLVNILNNGFRITAECQLNIEHCLIGFCSKDDVKYIKSHPQAIAQCRDYIYKNWQDNINLEQVFSTSNAVKSINKDNYNTVAIGSSYCANLYNLPIIESNINDEKNNTTRFVLLTKNKPQKSTNNKVSIVFSTENKPGALNRILSVIEKYNLNMTYIDSRPSRKELGEYIFYVDIMGHTDDSNVQNSLIEMQSHVKFFEILSEGANCI